MNRYEPRSRWWDTRGTRIVLIVCLVVRLGWLLAVSPWNHSTAGQIGLNNDSPGYHDIAVTLLNHGKFARAEDRTPDALRTPGYPLFVAGVYIIAGERPWVVMTIQVLLDAAACALLIWLFRRKFGSTIAIGAGLVYALDPHMVLYSTQLLSDSVFVFSLIGVMWIALSFLEESGKVTKWWCAAALGGALGIASLIRPIAQYLPFVVIVWMLIYYRGRLLHGILLSLTIFAGFTVICAPWVIRNQITFSHAALTTSGSYNLLVLHVAPVEAEKRDISLESATHELLAEADSLMAIDGITLDHANDFERAPYWSRVALRHALDSPFRTAMAYVRGIAFTFLNLGSADAARALGIPSTPLRDTHALLDKVAVFFVVKSRGEIFFAFLAGLFLFAGYVLAIRGTYVAGFWWRDPFITLCLLLGGYFVLIVGAGGLARFRLPVLPFYALFVGIAIEDMMKGRMSGSRIRDRQ